MSFVQESNLMQIPADSRSSGRSLTLGVAQPDQKQKSSKSIKSPVSISSGLNVRSSGGMFNFDMGQGLATMEKKKEKLEQLCAVMSSRKQKILQKEQLLNEELNKKSQLLGRIKILHEQSVAQNISSTSSNPAIRQIQQILEAKNNKELELERQIQQISNELKSRKSKQEQEVANLIRQTAEITNDTNGMQKQIEIARHSIPAPTQNSAFVQISEYKKDISILQQAILNSERDFAVSSEKRKQESAQREQNIQNLQNQFKILQGKKESIEKNIKNLSEEKQQQEVNMENNLSQLRKQYQSKLTQLKSTNKKFKVVDIVKNDLSQDQESKLKQQVLQLQQKVSKTNTDQVQKRIQQIQTEIVKLMNSVSNIKEDQSQLQAKKQQVQSASQKIAKLNQDIKSISQTTKSIAKDKEDAATALISEKEKYELYIKDNQFQKLQTETDKLRKKLKDEKTEYSKLESLNKQYVPASLIQQYKDKNKKYKEEVVELAKTRSEIQKMSKQLIELREEKGRLQWADNLQAIQLETAIKTLKGKKEQIATQNKDLSKKLTQCQSKVKQYKEYYPDFDVKIQKKASKKKSIKEQVDQKQTKEVKKVEAKKQQKKTEDKKQQETQQALSVKEEVVLQKSKPSPVKGKKDKKKKSTQANDEQILINQIIQLQNQLQDPSEITKTGSNISGKGKKQKVKKNATGGSGKKLKQNNRSKIEEQIQFLMQETKGETPKAPIRAFPIIAGLLVLFAGSSYWIFS